MTELAADTPLQRAPDLWLRVDASSTLWVYKDGTGVVCGPHGLAILDAFAERRLLSQVLSELQSRVTGTQDWIDLMSTIVRLHRSGVLQDPTAAGATPQAAVSGWGAAGIHIAMLNDRQRVSRYLTAIHEVVRPGDVVVDLGTGTGVLAIAAARAGARHVYAIEASSIGESARRIFAANGLADRITLLQGWSTRLDLPERADVLISELIGTEPLAENVIEVTVDARKRLLKPDARMVPRGIKLFGLPVTIPRPELVGRALTAETLLNWQSWYGIDFSPLAQVARDEPGLTFVRPYRMRDWQALADPILLAKVDFRSVTRLSIDSHAITTATSSGPLDGVAIYFELELSPTTSLSTHPSQVGVDSHWRSPVWTVVPPLTLQAGDRFEVRFRYRVAGHRSAVYAEKAGARRPTRSLGPRVEHPVRNPRRL